MIISDKFLLSSPHNHQKILGDVRYKPTGSKKPIILFIHGFKGFKDWGHFNLIADWFAEKEYVYCKFNLSHNGTTWDHPTEFVDLETFGKNNLSIELDDIGVVIDHVRDNTFPVPDDEFDKEAILMIGHSRGGGLTILKAAEDKRIRAITTWAAIYDVESLWPKEMVRQWEQDGVLYIYNERTGQNMPLYYQLVVDYQHHKKRLNIPGAASRINCPWLICHGTDDETLDYKMALDLKLLNEKAELFMMDGVTHTFGGGHPYNSSRLIKPTRTLIEKTDDFFRRSLS